MSERTKTKVVRLNSETTVDVLLLEMEKISMENGGKSVELSLNVAGTGDVTVNIGGPTWETRIIWEQVTPNEPDVPPIWP